MSSIKILSFAMLLTLLLISFLACGAPSATTQAPTASASVVTTQASTSSAPATFTTAPTTTAAEAVKPQGELVAALPDFGNENFIPWKASLPSSQICLLVYDMLIYYDSINLKFIPGLAENWEVSPDALTTTYHLRKGVEFSDGWGEFTSADVKYNFEMHASKTSVGKTAQARRITSMETPDPYTLVVHFKDPNPTFFQEFSLGNGGICQGIVSKKYVETVGEDVASQKPIGTGPWKLVDSQSASYFKFEALDSHWRVVPEFKTLTVHLIPEVSSIISALKNKEIDLASIPAEQLADLKTAGVATEVSPAVGYVIIVTWGGLVIPEDKRYDPVVHNKDPWTDVRVRKAMTICIDREAICKAIYAGGAEPVGVPLISADMNKYQYPYDQAAAKQLLKDAGYPNGFSFRTMSYTVPGAPETPRLMEALAGYWQQIGLDPKITVIDYNTYNAKNLTPLKTAGDLSLFRISAQADMLSKAALFLIPGAVTVVYEDEASYALWKEGDAKMNANERAVYADKLNQYYYDNYGPIPVVEVSYNFAWNSTKISPFPHPPSTTPYYLEYVRHAQPLNTFRLFTPWPGR